MYREHAFCDDLQPFVAAIWTNRSSAVQSADVVLPDGCCDIVFTFVGGGIRSRVIGTMTHAIEVSDREPTDYLGVRFKPGAITSFLPLFAQDFTDGSCDLGSFRLDWLRRLEEQLWRDPTPRVLERLLVEQSRLAKAPDLYVSSVCQKLEECRGFVSVEELSSFTGVSRQYLSRVFRQHVGISTKTFARVLRFRTALRIAKQDPDNTWAQIAATLGYSDQSHLVAEFQALAGTCPSEYMRR